MIPKNLPIDHLSWSLLEHCRPQVSFQPSQQRESGNPLQLETLVGTEDGDEDDVFLGIDGDPDLWRLQVAYGIKDLGRIIGHGRRDGLTGG